MAASTLPAGMRRLATPQAGLVLATFLMASSFVAGRALRGQVDPLLLNFCRWAIACLALAPFYGAALVRHRAQLRRHIGLVAVLGLAGFVVPHTSSYFAVQTTSAINAMLLMNMVPLLVALGAGLFLRQPLRPAQWLGLAVSLTGAAGLLVRFDPQVLQALRFTQGDLWMLPAALSVAAHILLLRRAPAGVPPGALLLASALAAALLMLPGVLLAGPAAWQVPPEAWPTLLYIGVGTGALAFALWNGGVARIGPQRAAPFMYLMPAHGAVLSMLLLAEPPHAWQIAGAALVLAGLWLAAREARPAPGGARQTGKIAQPAQ